MAISLYDVSIPLFIDNLTNMRAWLDKATAHRLEAELVDARLAPDMRPLIAQYQMASDSAKNCAARLAGVDAPAMPDTEETFADLRARCDRTIAYLKGIDRDAIDGQEARPVELKFPNGTAYRFEGLGYLTGFALPNFFFHATTAYAILRAQGVALGKPDFLAHLGAPQPAVVI
ncbi:MAG TPA: DUF1993 domain-containing protein [Sphingobium sp.]